MTNDQLDRSFLDANIPELVKQMTMPEKISLLAGKDWWNTVPIERLNVPSVKVTDGPNGARGGSFFKMTPASAIPSATSLGATFSRKHIHSAGQLLALEAKARGAVCLLAPTINIQRSPLGGRAFESYSEDPTLSGHIAAAYVNGLQEGGVSATIKHFVGNDQEHERMGEDSIIPERALREVYLRPFQIAQKDAKPWAYMTSYNKVNGTHVSENETLLRELLRKEWGHDGLIMSDWYGTYSVSDSINAGLNLEMPGPARWRNPELVNHLLGAHKIDRKTIDKHAIEILSWVQKLVKLNPDLVYAKPIPEQTRDDKEKDAAIIRSLGTEGIVLLKNNDNVLPISDKRKVAVIGPNAKDRVLSGGGSALLASAWSQTPWEGLQANKPQNVELSYALGAYTAKFLPIFDLDLFSAPSNGKPGFDLLHYPIKDGKKGDKAVVEETWHKSDMFLADFYHPDLGQRYWTEVKANFTSPIDGDYEFGLAVTGHARLWVDDELVVDTKGQKKGSVYFNCGTEEKRGRYKVQKGKQYTVRMLHNPEQPAEDITGDSTPFIVTGIRIGAFRAFDADEEIEEAVKLAKSVDTAVIVAGLNADWESEGYDRPDLTLPLRTNELISRVAAVNPKTVVVLQAGSAVSMPWVDEVAGIVFAWYGGNETGNAIADIIYGTANPSGRLPLTFPVKEQDIAAALNYKSARTKIHYEEGIWVGYKHHNARAIPPLFPFGHGLSYSTFEYEDLQVTKPTQGAKADADGWKVEVQVTVKNTGKVAGSHSVHFYTCPPAETATGLKHPSHALQAFEKVYDLQPGKSEVVNVTLDKYAVSHWDDYDKTFRAETGEWTVKVGKDAQTLWGDAKFTIEDDMEWRGL